MCQHLCSRHSRYLSSRTIVMNLWESSRPVHNSQPPMSVGSQFLKTTVVFRFPSSSLHRYEKEISILPSSNSNCQDPCHSVVFPNEWNLTLPSLLRYIFAMVPGMPRGGMWYGGATKQSSLRMFEHACHTDIHSANQAATGVSAKLPSDVRHSFDRYWYECRSKFES